MRLTLAIVALSALAFFGMTVLAVWWRQERIAYQPPTETPAAPRDARRVEYAASDGVPLYGYVIDPAGPAAGVLIAFHGNADLATWQIPWGREVARRTGWRVLLAEYRGYGGLAGVPSYVGLQRDARAAWTFARDHLGAATNPVALFGHSLGSAVAVELAAEVVASATSASGGLVGLVLQSPFTSARDMARVVSTRPVHFLWNLIARVHYDTRSKLAGMDVPVSVAHGAQDWLVPVAMGRELYATAPRPGRLLVVPNAGHNDVDDVAGDSYWQWISAALRDREANRSPRRSAARSESRYRTETSD
jgi:pimeloyl-ACP methyl ester carboxylesterase